MSSLLVWITVTIIGAALVSGGVAVLLRGATEVTTRLRALWRQARGGGP